MEMVLARGCLAGGFADACPAGQRFLTSATLDTMARDRTIGTTIIFRPPTTIGFGYGIGQWIENADGVNAHIAQPLLSTPCAYGVTPWVDHARSVAGVLFVEDQLTAVNADINDVRSMVNVVTAEAMAVACGRPSPRRDIRPNPTHSPCGRLSRGGAQRAGTESSTNA